MVTAMVVVDTLTLIGIDPAMVRYRIRSTSISIGGTSANLQLEKEYSLLDLLYGMMLPSGNDAAVALGEAVGLLEWMRVRGKSPEGNLGWYEGLRPQGLLFMGLMNTKVSRLGLRDTKFYNCHGNDAY
ncbi:unnamed protein product [Sphagnum balticum]